MFVTFAVLKPLTSHWVSLKHDWNIACMVVTWLVFRLVRPLTVVSSLKPLNQRAVVVGWNVVNDSSKVTVVMSER